MARGKHKRRSVVRQAQSEELAQQRRRALYERELEHLRAARERHAAFDEAYAEVANLLEELRVHNNPLLTSLIDEVAALEKEIKELTQRHVDPINTRIVERVDQRDRLALLEDAFFAAGKPCVARVGIQNADVPNDVAMVIQRARGLRRRGKLFADSDV